MNSNSGFGSVHLSLFRLGFTAYLALHKLENAQDWIIVKKDKRLVPSSNFKNFSKVMVLRNVRIRHCQ